MSHTKGPWVVAVSDDNGIHCVDAPSNTDKPIEICEVWGTVFDKKESEESRANARLIAAAPDMLEALNECLNWIDPHPMHDGIRAKVDAAIAKATQS